MITQKMKYALKALMELAAERAGEGRPLRIEEIATRSDTPKRFLEHILLEIRNAGFIASARGRHGGYILIKNPREVPLSEIMRLCALADWHFSGGDSYCQACETQCQDCPARLNQPLSLDGWQVWDLVGRLGGQMRVAVKAVIGWDIGAALALARALGLNPMVVAELLPELEAAMVRNINEKFAATE